VLRRTLSNSVIGILSTTYFTRQDQALLCRLEFLAAYGPDCASPKLWPTVESPV
jgi:hypothetical protein